MPQVQKVFFSLSTTTSKWRHTGLFSFLFLFCKSLLLSLFCAITQNEKGRKRRRKSNKKSSLPNCPTDFLYLLQIALLYKGMKRPRKKEHTNCHISTSFFFRAAEAARVRKLLPPLSWVCGRRLAVSRIFASRKKIMQKMNLEGMTVRKREGNRGLRAARKTRRGIGFMECGRKLMQSAYLSSLPNNSAKKQVNLRILPNKQIRRIKTNLWNFARWFLTWCCSVSVWSSVPPDSLSLIACLFPAPPHRFAHGK